VSIGTALAAARAHAGMTVQDVADRTRIRRTVIEFIERDDFTLCGGDVYARGHLRTIANLLGLDPGPLVAEFNALHPGESPSAAEVFESETAARPERVGPNWTAAMATALVVVVALGVFQLVRGGSTTPAVSAGGGAVSSSPTVTPSPSPSATAAASPSKSAIAVLPPTDGVSVRLTATGGASWISATTGARGTKPVFQGLLRKGETKTFGDPTLVKLVIGNAGAVRLLVNGRDLGAAGGAGQVVRASFGPGDPAAG